MKRHDYRRPVPDRAGLPLTEYPTPNIEDLVIVEDYSAAVSEFEPLVRGTPHPHVPTAKLVHEEPRAGNNNERQVRRIYATNRAAQDAYNASTKFVSDSISHPVYIRSYIERRPASRLTPNLPLTSLISITLGAGGSGYVTAPGVSFSGGAGSGAEAVAVVQDGVVVALWLTDGGTGYTSAPTVAFTPGGTTAAASYTPDPRGIVVIDVSSGGTGYVSIPTVTITGGGGTGAAATASISGGSVVSIAITAQGTGYTTPPTIAISGGGGSGAAAVAELEAFSIDGSIAIVVVSGGTGYTSTPTLTITDSQGNGSGATAVAVMAGQRVGSVSIVNTGDNYTGSIVITFTGGHSGGSGATATAHIQETSAVLTHQEFSPAPGDNNSIFDQVVRVYSTQPGPIIKETTAYKWNTFWVNSRQAVAPATLPSQPSGVTVEDTVRQSSTTEAERITRTLVDSAGTTATGFPIYQTSRRDEKTGVLITTDHFLAAATYVLPATFTGGTAATIAAGYPTWKQPSTDHLTFTGGDYSPSVHYVFDARKNTGPEGSDLVVVEIDHGPIPSARVDDSRPVGFTFPAIFKANETVYSYTSDYGGTHLPPWPIGENEVGGFRLTAHRTGEWPTRRILTYALGRKGNLPEKYTVTTPGVASSKYRIPENCIHNAIGFSETLTTGVIQTIEDIPASTPSTYSDTDILVVDAVERRWLGEIYETEVILISEATPLTDFPDPTALSYNIGSAGFPITPEISFTAETQEINGSRLAVMNGRPLVISTTGGATCTVTLFGRAVGSEEVVAVRESVSASGSAVATTHSFLSLREVMLSAPLASGTVVVQHSVDPSTATLDVGSTPADGDIMSVGLSPNAPIYQFRTTLTSDAVTSITVTAGGSGYQVAPAVSIAAGGTQAYASASVSGGVVTAIIATYPGTGYNPASAPVVSFSDGGTAATATAVLTSNSVTSFSVSVGGTRYSSAPSVTLTTAGSAATATGALTGDAVSSITVATPGSGYTSAPVVTITGGGGSGATAHAVISGGGAVTSIVVDAGGSGYISAVTIVLTYGRGQGAKGTATASGGAVTAIAVKTATFTANASTNIITATAHGLSDGDGLTFASSVTLPGGISAATVYYVQVTTVDTFKIATSIANLVASTTVDITTAGTGTHTMTYCGQGYLTAPTVSFSGGTGSGATATAVVSQARQILISSAPKTMAARIVQAINGLSLGSNVGLGTTAHADLRAKRSAAEPTTVEFSSTSATSAPGSASWTLSVSTGIPFVNQTSATWCTVSSFTAGGAQDTICTITAGVGQAFIRTNLSGNRQLFDESSDNDANATPNLPAAAVLYTDWVALTQGTSPTIKYSVAGAPAVRFAVQTASTAAVPATVTASVTVTTGLATISSGTNLTPYIGCKIVIPGDTVENELTSTTTLLRTVSGAGGTVTATITPLVATTMGNAINGVVKRYSMGVIGGGTGFGRLKITQLVTPYKYRAARAKVAWSIAP